MPRPSRRSSRQRETRGRYPRSEDSCKSTTRPGTAGEAKGKGGTKGDVCLQQQNATASMQGDKTQGGRGRGKQKKRKGSRGGGEILPPPRRHERSLSEAKESRETATAHRTRAGTRPPRRRPRRSRVRHAHAGADGSDRRQTTGEARTLGHGKTKSSHEQNERRPTTSGESTETSEEARQQKRRSTETSRSDVMRAQTGREARARATASRRERNRGEGERRKKKRKRTRPAAAQLH
jgi:hypothetical protein